MNNYLTTSSSGETSEREEALTEDRERERRERLQERHYAVFQEMKTLAGELPMKYQQRLPYELLSNLSSCLLDDTIPQIVAGLKDIQHITEKTLFEKRMRSVDAFKAKKVEIQKKLKEDLSSHSISAEQAKTFEKNFDKHVEEELQKLDMKLVTELDQVVSEQQVTLERAGVPGFHVTNNPVEIKLQMYILDFITRLSDM